MTLKKFTYEMRLKKRSVDRVSNYKRLAGEMLIR